MQTKKKPSQKIIHVLLLLMFLFGTAAVRFSEQKSVSAQSGNTILAESTFDTGTEGWGIINDGTPPTHYTTGGPGGAHIRSSDLQTGAYWYWNAPAEFLGDKSAAYNGSLTFYLYQNKTDYQSNNQDDVLLIGSGYTLVYNTTSNPLPTWRYYSISLLESAGWKNKATGFTATQAEMQAVLANLQTIQIRGEYRIGADTGGIDSVYLKSAPFTPTPTLTSTPTATATFTPIPTGTPVPTNTPMVTCVFKDYEVRGITGNNGVDLYNGVRGNSYIWDPAVAYSGVYVNSVWIMKNDNNIVELGWAKLGEKDGGGYTYFRAYVIDGSYHLDDKWGAPAANMSHEFKIYYNNLNQEWEFYVDDNHITPDIPSPNFSNGVTAVMRERHTTCDSGWAHIWGLHKYDSAGNWSIWQTIDEEKPWPSDDLWFLDIVSSSEFFVTPR